MSPQETFLSLYGFVVPLACILGLGLAFRWVRRLAVYYPFPETAGKRPNGVLLLLAWLALGSLLARPFLEVIGFIWSLGILFFNPYQFASPYEAEAPFGLAPEQFKFLVNLLQTLLVYAYIAWIGARFYRQGQLGFLDRVAAGRFERLLLVLVFAGLVNGLLSNVWSGLELGLANFMDQLVVLRMLIAWGALAFLLLNLAISLARRLEPTELTEEEPLEDTISFF